MTDFSIKRFNKYGDAELIAALRDFAKRNGRSHVSGRTFAAATGISETTVAKRFGTWRAFCERAGLAPRYQRPVSRADLFENLERVWQALGRQPRAKEMKQPLSPISGSRYSKEFRVSWYQICLEFLAYKTGAPTSEIERESCSRTVSRSAAQSHVTHRAIPVSLRYAVLKRDHFRCVKCGRSPASSGVSLHVDHIQAWANGGESVERNLQTLCSDCNLGKSDKHDG